MSKMLFYRTSGNGVSVKIDWKGGYRYRSGTGRGIRRNKGKDREEYPMIVSYGVLDSFMGVNGISDKDVVIDKKSIDEFYGFYDEWNEKWFVSATLTSEFVDEWWNYDCPNLYRMAPNKDGHTNWFGLKLSCFQNLLCESSFYSTSIGEDITEEEVTKLTKDREHTGIYKEMQLMLKTRTISEDEVEKIKLYVKEYEDKVQTVIDMFQSEIVGAVARIKDSPPAGFLNIFTTDEEYNEKKSMLKQLDKKGHHASWMDVRLPRSVQSLLIQEEQFKVAKEKVKKALGIDLYHATVLD